MDRLTELAGPGPAKQPGVGTSDGNPILAMARELDLEATAAKPRSLTLPR
ncbi:MAG TPA: hypothetical protein VMA73_32205 [Streptosporangiaceae bacterium]|nr:hypothetical protein [Streptosporangiaceae bacterium]